MTELLTQIGVVKALQSMAGNVGGVNTDDGDAVLAWAEGIGWIVRNPHHRDHVILTPVGERAVWLWWAAWKELREGEKAAGALIIPSGSGSEAVSGQRAD